jgi:S1-C subfamily serine protease
VDPRLTWGVMAVLLSLLVMLLWQQAAHPPPKALTQKDIDAAVLRTLTTQNIPSRTARAAEKIRPAVVRVVAYVKDKKGEDVEHGVGTGVVIQDKGIILTNLHVVQAAQSIKLTFADGSESKAHVSGVQAQHDLAVLQAHTIPDDFHAATLRTTADLMPGDEVVAVGFPFGIGPSTSAGVVSGLGRSFKSPEGTQEISNLIQFDAAANPGNSGGPLVTMDGEVVGVVTGILNPTRARTFLGIGFAVPIESAASAAGLPPF